MQKPRMIKHPLLCVLFATVACQALSIPVNADSQTRLYGNVTPAIGHSDVVGALQTIKPITLAIGLRMRNSAGLVKLINDLYDPNSASYGKYISADEFASKFGATNADYSRVLRYARSRGLHITQTYANRLLVNVSGTPSQVNQAFRLHLMVYRSRNTGRFFYGPDSEPLVTSGLESIINSVIGLDSATVAVSHLASPAVSLSSFQPFGVSDIPLQIGSGPNGSLAPSDIKTAYNLNSVTQDGTGQVLGLYELDGYNTSDISGYESHFGLPAVTLQNVYVDGYTSGPASTEVTLDIELQIALAPHISKILVYEGQNGSVGMIDAYTQIATDNSAKSISSSWGIQEGSSGYISQENTAFMQMASQGQSMFSSSGDSGAYDDGSTLSVDDPASQPYGTGVGGTRLATNGAGGTYSSETTWNSSGGLGPGTGGGGGISQVWSIPSWQSGLVPANSLGSTTKRNVPDVSLDADPNTGYAIYNTGAWQVWGGTSCAAPLWAAFTALVNQKRAANGLATIGLINPTLYTLSTGSKYATDFHDINDGSTNGYYPAVTGYDDATGLGTFNGANLISDISGPGFVAGNYFMIKNNASGEVADDLRGSMMSGNIVVQDSYSAGVTSQEWSLIPQSDGNYRIINRMSGMCLSINGTGTVAGTRVIQLPATSAKTVEWKVISLSSPAGYFTLTNAVGTLLLDNYTGSTAAGAAIDIWPSNGLSPQQWQIIQVSS